MPPSVEPVAPGHVNVTFAARSVGSPEARGEGGARKFQHSRGPWLWEHDLASPRGASVLCASGLRANAGICALGGGLGRFVGRVDPTSPRFEISAITGGMTLLVPDFRVGDEFSVIGDAIVHQ